MTDTDYSRLLPPITADGGWRSAVNSESNQYEGHTQSSDTPATGNADRETVVVVGKESVGKSELVSSLTGDRPTSGNFRGTTTRSERYTTDGYEFVDTPGIVLDTDTEGTRDALAQVDDDETLRWRREDGTLSRVAVSGAAAQQVLEPFSRNVIGAQPGDRLVDWMTAAEPEASTDGVR